MSEIETLIRSVSAAKREMSVSDETEGQMIGVSGRPKTGVTGRPRTAATVIGRSTTDETKSQKIGVVEASRI